MVNACLVNEGAPYTAQKAAAVESSTVEFSVLNGLTAAFLCTVEANLSSTVHQLKAAIQDETGLSIHEQVLLADGAVLESGTVLEEKFGTTSAVCEISVVLNDSGTFEVTLERKDASLGIGVRREGGGIFVGYVDDGLVTSW